ncbi:hypothetical protein L1049_012360 [Liquidambar formosana]|uniref:DUF7356 domain-containing protein n=1 Tax=Liquidambar formosana TaxID=63359 RepID=A0AAP0RSU6_LIQFO
MRMIRKRVFVVLLLVLIVAHGSEAASLLQKVRKLIGVAPNKKPDEIAPSPGPGLSVNSDPNRTDTPATSPEPDPIDGLTNERCKKSFDSCHKGSITACIQPAGGAHEELWLLVQNGGESTLKVNGIIKPSNTSLKEMQIPKHHAKKINISATAGKIQSVVLNAGNGDCMILMGASQGNKFTWFPSYAAQVTPIHGAYLLSFTALLIGGIWACCKWGKRGRQVDGIPYQELEMGQPDSPLAINVETAEGWDQGWDDDWDEEKAVKSPGGNHGENVSANGHSKSSNGNGWEKEWDD